MWAVNHPFSSVSTLCILSAIGDLLAVSINMPAAKMVICKQPSCKSLIVGHHTYDVHVPSSHHILPHWWQVDIVPFHIVPVN